MLGGSRAKIARAKNSGGAAGGGAAPEHSEAEGRANQMKFDIFCKRSAKGYYLHNQGLYQRLFARYIGLFCHPVSGSEVLTSKVAVFALFQNFQIIRMPYLRVAEGN